VKKSINRMLNRVGDDNQVKEAKFHRGRESQCFHRRGIPRKERENCALGLELSEELLGNLLRDRGVLGAHFVDRVLHRSL
jgi:hypothetical protein